MSEINPFTPPSPYEDGISNRARRALRPLPGKERLDLARQAQKASGIRIRIARPVKDQRIFRDELRIWHEPVQNNVAKRKNLGALAMTIFDSDQQPLRYPEEHSEDSIKALFMSHYPELFKDTPALQVAGLDHQFGDDREPFIGLVFAPGHAHQERIIVRNAIAPELWLSDDHQQAHRPHVSLGQVFRPELVTEIESLLLPAIPDYVVFAAAKVIVERRDTLA